MRLLRQLTSVMLSVGVLACSAGKCPLPDEWVWATSLEPSPVPYTPRVAFYAEETQPGRWVWRGSTVTYEQLLRQVTLASALDPQPLLIFSFAEGQSCAQLNAARAGISKAAACSKDGIPCIQGTPDQLP